MAFIHPENRVIEAEGYVRTSNYSDVDDVYREIARAVEEYSSFDVEDSYPSYVYKQKVWKVTIKVEVA